MPDLFKFAGTKQRTMSQPTTAFAIEGRLHKVFEMEAKTGTFSSRDFVIEIGGQYPQVIKFQLVQDRCGLIDPFKEGDPIKVHFDLRGREWNGKYLTNLHAWKLDRLADEAPTPTATGTVVSSGSIELAPGQVLPYVAVANDTAKDIFGDDQELPF